MPMRWSYVGALGRDGMLDWGRSAGANIPSSGTLPNIEDLLIYQAISKLAATGEYEGQVVDHDAYGLKVNGADLRCIIEACYELHPEKLLEPPIAQHLEYADNLPPNQYVALVAVAM